MAYKLPYIPDKRLYAAVMGACSYVRNTGWFNKATEYYANKYGVNDDYAQGGYIYNMEDPENDKKFDEYMKRRDICRLYLEEMENAVFKDYPFMRRRATSPWAVEAGDIYRTLRHQFAWHQYPHGGLGVDFDEPFRIGPEPLPKCYVREAAFDAERKEHER